MKHLLNKILFICFLSVAYIGTTFAQNDLLAENVSMSAANVASLHQTDEKITFGDLIQNKNNSKLSVNATSPTTMQVKYFSLSGNMAKKETVTIEAGNNELEVNMDNLEAGVYMVQFYTAQGSAVRRVVKN